jgi:uncharacterized protein (TIGR02466 family)
MMSDERRSGAALNPQDVVFQQFPTTVLWRIYPDVQQLNAALGRLVRRLRDRGADGSAGSTTVGGFQTDNEFLKIADPAVDTLRSMVNASIQAFLSPYFAQDLITPPTHVEAVQWGWAVLMKRDDYNMPHVHPNAHVSGVYYVEMPEIVVAPNDVGTPGGSLVFYDPRGSTEMYQLENHRAQQHIIPTPGSMIVFPSYYRHAVFPYRAKGERLSIAFNARLKIS